MYAVITCWLMFLVNYSRGMSTVLDEDATTGLQDLVIRHREAHTNSLFIYPGTKWCGPGDIADNYDDLGIKRDTDKCCRTHDHCDDYIGSKQSKHNLTNLSPYVSLLCACDTEFYQCLKSLNTRDSLTVGAIYFNALGTECFKEEHPILNCLQRSSSGNLKCEKYDLNKEEAKIYQFFDVPTF